MMRYALDATSLSWVSRLRLAWAVLRRSEIPLSPASGIRIVTLHLSTTTANTTTPMPR